MALDPTDFAAAMATYLANNDLSIALRRGLASAVPSGLLQGEPYFGTDTKTIYMGNGNGTNSRLATKAELDVGIAAANLLTLIKTVDGSGSGLDADMVDGMAPATAATASTLAQRDANGDLTARVMVSNVATGTAPLTVSSTTKVTNLNADKIGGIPNASVMRNEGGASYPFTAMPYVGTAPIVESGSNANGNYIKYADGTMICFGTPGTLTAPTATGSMYVSSTGLTWTYPEAFYAAPVVGGSFAHSLSVLTYNTLGTTSVVLYRLCTVTASSAITARVWAFGRWKA